MNSLPITLVATAVLALLYVWLSVRVTIARSRSKIGLGSGAETSAALGQEHTASPLLVAVRSHGNFAEYVPISLILLALLELTGADRRFLVGLASALVVARLMIAFGMGRAAPNPFRAGGSLLQWTVIVVASAYGLWLVFAR